jgi:hypothetical protein
MDTDYDQKSTAVVSGARMPLRAVFLQIILSVVIAGSLFGLLRIFFPSTLAALTAPPKLVDIEPSSTFACTAHEGDVVLATFSIRNITNEKLKVLGVQTGCSCTSVQTKFPLELPAGGVGRIEMQLTVGRPAADGKFRRTAVLFVDREGIAPQVGLEATVERSSSSI